MNRRTYLVTCWRWSALAAVAGPLMGCGAATTSGPTPPAASVPVTYSSTPEFAAELSRRLADQQSMIVAFDGTAVLAEGTPLLDLLSDRQRIQNHEECWQALDAFDTEEGRSALAKAFAAPLLQHEVVTRIDGAHTRASGQVVAPGVVLMTLIIGLLCSFTVVATTQIVTHGPIVAEWTFDPTTKMPLLKLAPAIVR